MIDQTHVVLGIDGGGTKTEFVVADLAGIEVASHVSGPTNLAAVSPEESMLQLEAGLRALQSQLIGRVIGQTVIGVAGVDTAADERRFRQLATPIFAKYGITEFSLLNDSQLVLANGSDAADALILIAGTGSICFGQNAEGSTARSGGMDYLLADEGSGYWIGRKVLRAVVRAHDGRGSQTTLARHVFEHFKIAQYEELKSKVYQPPLTKMQIAEVAKVWELALKDGDEVAKLIQYQVVDELAALVQSVARALGVTDRPFDLVLAGSIARLPIVEPLLRARLEMLHPHIIISLPNKTPVHGAIKLALRAAGV